MIWILMVFVIVEAILIEWIIRYKDQREKHWEGVVRLLNEDKETLRAQIQSKRKRNG